MRFSIRHINLWRMATIPTIALLVSFPFLTVKAQTIRAASNQIPKPPARPPDITGHSDDRGPLTTYEEEMRAKRLIRLAEKEHEDNLKRAKEISQLGQDLRECVKAKSNLGREDTKKLERLEKLTKKVRGEAGGEDDDVQILDAPSDVPSALTLIADNAELLSKDVQNTPRQVVSASVIDRANVLLKLLKIVRGFFR
jgi:hypothetical protein